MLDARHSSLSAQEMHCPGILRQRKRCRARGPRRLIYDFSLLDRSGGRAACARHQFYYIPKPDTDPDRLVLSAFWPLVVV